MYSVISKNQIKYLKSLSTSKFRQKYNKFVAEGDKLALEFIKTSAFQIEMIFAYPSWIEDNTSILYKKDLPITEVNEKSMRQITNLKTPSSVFLLLNKPEETVKINLKHNEASFFLDGVQDPGNVGTIIRTADWFGIKNIFANENTADWYNPKVIQSTMGSICHVKCIRLKGESIAALFNDTPSYGLMLDGEDISTQDELNPGIYVLGSEGQGISPKIQSLVSRKIRIPGHHSKGAESLNVAISSGIIASRIKIN